jgi:hypothetical protein
VCSEGVDDRPGQWDTGIDRGATWHRTLRYTGSAGTVINLSAPAFMDIRVKMDEDAAPITRLDSTGDAPGDITIAGNVVTLLLPDEVTATLPPDKYYFDAQHR